jgi:hypothetical protein
MDADAAADAIFQHRARAADRSVGHRALSAGRLPRGEPDLARRDRSHRHRRISVRAVERPGAAPRQAALERNQYQGRYSFTGGERWWQTPSATGAAVAPEPMAGRTSCSASSSSRSRAPGRRKITLLEENTAIYAWDNSEARRSRRRADDLRPDQFADPRRHPRAQGDDRQHADRRAVQPQMDAERRRRAGAPTPPAATRRATSLIIASSARARRWSARRLSEKVRVNPARNIISGSGRSAERRSARARGSTSAASGSARRHDVVGTFTEGTQQTPSGLTAGALPKEINWSGTAPSDAFYVQLKFYTPALASSSGTFRIERRGCRSPTPAARRSITYGPDDICGRL